MVGSGWHPNAELRSSFLCGVLDGVTPLSQGVTTHLGHWALASREAPATSVCRAAIEASLQPRAPLVVLAHAVELQLQLPSARRLAPHPVACGPHPLIHGCFFWHSQHLPWSSH